MRTVLVARSETEAATALDRHPALAGEVTDVVTLHTIGRLEGISDVRRVYVDMGSRDSWDRGEEWSFPRVILTLRRAMRRTEGSDGLVLRIMDTP